METWSGLFVVFEHGLRRDPKLDELLTGPGSQQKHTVPHLKGLNSGLEPSTRRGHSTFTLHHTILKSAHSIHKQANQWFHINIAVHMHFSCVLVYSNKDLGFQVISGLS